MASSARSFTKILLKSFWRIDESFVLLGNFIRFLYKLELNFIDKVFHCDKFFCVHILLCFHTIFRIIVLGLHIFVHFVEFEQVFFFYGVFCLESVSLYAIQAFWDLLLVANKFFDDFFGYKVVNLLEFFVKSFLQVANIHIFFSRVQLFNFFVIAKLKHIKVVAVVIMVF